MTPSDQAPAPTDRLEMHLPDETATARVATALAPLLVPAMVIHVSGNLGAGKTAFCRALIRSLGYNGRVKSPTFTLLEPYNFPQYTLYHFDLYRFSSENELREAGFEEQLDSQAVALVEWPERAAGRLATPDLLLCLEPGEHPDERWLRIAASTDAGRRCLSRLRDAVS